MRRVLNAAVVCALALAVSSCMTPPNPYGATGAAQVGSAHGAAADGGSTSYVPPPASTTPPPPLKDASVDQNQSAALTNYLKSHRLPLVGARVLQAPGGERQVMLYGFVATQYGKNDAEAKVHTYINDPSVTVDNRIKIEPQLAQSTAGSTGSSSSAGGYDPSMGGVQAYENQQAQDAYQQSQINQYQSQSQGPSMLSTLIPLLGMFGGSFGGGSFGGTYGGFGTSYGPYGGYGYPNYPPAPPPGFGYGPPYAPYP
jgi:hypothetical protein